MSLYVILLWGTLNFVSTLSKHWFRSTLLATTAQLGNFLRNYTVIILFMWKSLEKYMPVKKTPFAKKWLNIRSWRVGKHEITWFLNRL
jgi:hypothetical protein